MKNDHLDRMLEDIESNIGASFENFESECFEVENALVAAGTPRSLARPKALQLVATAKTKPMALKGAEHGGAGNFQFSVTLRSVASGSGLASEKLPVVIFGYLDYLNNYASVMSGMLPTSCSGYTLAIINNGDMQYTFNDTSSPSKSVVITVDCAEYPYLPFLFASGMHVFTMSQIRISLSDKTKLQQFNTVLRPYHRTMFGTDNKNTITQSTQKTPTQFQDGIINLTAAIPIDSERGIITQIDCTTGAGFSVSYSCFVEQKHHHTA